MDNAAQKPTPFRSIAGKARNIGMDGKMYQKVASVSGTKRARTQILDQPALQDNLSKDSPRALMIL
jgi:hypothetical protein